MNLLVGILLGLAALAALLGAAATWRLSRPLDRIHAGGFTALGCGVPLVAAAMIADGFSPRSFKCLLILFVVVLGNAVTSHAVGRATHLRGGNER